MKKITMAIVLFFVVFSIANSQVPEKFNYQGILRNSSDELIENTNVSIQISLLEGSASGSTVYVETHDVQTNDYGQFAVQVGNGVVVSGDFGTVDWASGQVYLKTEVDELGGSSYTELGVVQLVTVPYAMYAKDVENKDDADADPNNEIQQLSFLGDTLEISDGNKIVFPYDNSNWVVNGDQMYYNGGNVGIGSSVPVSKLEVKSNTAGSDALFQVINSNNDTVFAVYPDGVKVFIDPDAKGKVGGFAISGRSPSKAGEVEYMRVTSDSTRIYVNEPIDGKGSVGGFAISGRSPSKGLLHDYLVVTNDSTRIYINDTATLKGKVGGFAISGRSPSKGLINDYLQVTRDSTRVYISEPTTKGKVGGFAISGRSPSKGVVERMFFATIDSTRIYTQDTTSGFGVRDNSSGSSVSYMQLTPKNYFIGHQSGDNTTPGDPFETSGKFNNFFGYQSGFNNKTGAFNTLIGYQSGYADSTGDYNVYIGYRAGYLSQDSRWSTCIGRNSGYFNQNDNNTFIGVSSGYSNSFGASNTFVGKSSGYKNTTGQTNVYVGTSAGYDNIAGGNNVMVGAYAGWMGDDGSNNVHLGHWAGAGNTGSGNIFIGYQAGYQINSTMSNRMYIDNTSATDPLIYGEFDNRQIVINGNGYDNPSDYTFYVNGRGGGDYVWNSLSDERLKKNILTIENPIELVSKLRGVTFEWKDPESQEKGRRIGFIAQETVNVLPEVVDDSGDIFSMQYAPITAVLVEAVKEQQTQIDELSIKNTELIKIIFEMKKEIKELKIQ